MILVSVLVDFNPSLCEKKILPATLNVDHVETFYEVEDGRSTLVTMISGQTLRVCCPAQAFEDSLEAAIWHSKLR